MAGTPLVGEREEGGTVLSSGLNVSGKIHAEGMLSATSTLLFREHIIKAG
jgi:hypothetical protein